jgi:hypothetical protein
MLLSRLVHYRVLAAVLGPVGLAASLGPILTFYPVQVWLVALSLDGKFIFFFFERFIIGTALRNLLPTSPVVMVLLSSGILACTSTSLLSFPLSENRILFHWTFSWWGRLKRERETSFQL